MTRRNASFILMAAALVASAAPVLGGSTLPRAISAAALAAPDGMPATGFPWRAWPQAAPSRVSSGQPGESLVGAIRPDGVFGDVGDSAFDGLVAVPGPWVLVVEGESPEGAVYFGVSQAQFAGPFPALELTQFLAPSVALDGPDVRVAWSALPPGVEAVRLLRSAPGAAPIEVARVIASADPSFLDAAPVGEWTYALRAVFTGGVDGLHVSPSSDSITVIPFLDGDSDRVGDDVDNCVMFANADQADADRDGVADACDFAFGDIAPVARPDRRVDVADVVRSLRLGVGLEVATPDEVARANVAPATITPGDPEIATPSLAEPRSVDIADTVLLMRAAVGLTRLASPR